MSLNGAKLGSKKYLPEMRTFADLLRDTLDHGIPGHEGINPVQWVEKFAPGFDVNLIYQAIKCQRTPTIEKSIRLGFLMKKSGAKVGIYDFLEAAAHGIWSEVSKEHELTEDDMGDRLALGKPKKVDVDPSAEYAVDVYRTLSWEDRITAANELLLAIARDVKYYKMTDDLEVIRELVREAIANRSLSVEAFAKLADVPFAWLKNILDGKWDKVREESESDYLITLSDKIKDLNGKTRNCEFLAPLMSKELMKGYLKEVRKRSKV